MAKKQEYGNESITSLKGADRVRKRPAVIFARTGWKDAPIRSLRSYPTPSTRPGTCYGKTIHVTPLQGRQRAGGGLWPGACRWTGTARGPLQLGTAVLRDVRGRQVRRRGGTTTSTALASTAWPVRHPVCLGVDDRRYLPGRLPLPPGLREGRERGGLHKEPYKGRRTGSIIHWKPDDEVFTDIQVPAGYYKDVLRRQAVVNAGLTLTFTDELEPDPATGKPWQEMLLLPERHRRLCAGDGGGGRFDPRLCLRVGGVGPGPGGPAGI